MSSFIFGNFSSHIYLNYYLKYKIYIILLSFLESILELEIPLCTLHLLQFFHIFYLLTSVDSPIFPWLSTNVLGP